MTDRDLPAHSARAAYRILRADPVMAGLIATAGRYRPEPLPDHPPFQSLVRAIAHQQLHGVAAQRILGRFIELCGDGGFPKPQQVLAAADAQLRGVGFSYAKIAALKDLAAKTIEGTVPPRAELDTLADAEIIERLTAVRGIGRWTVEMMLMFQLQRPDVLPVDDFGVRNGFRLAYRLRGMPTPRALAQFGERWRPHRSLAAWYLWRAVDLARRDLLPRAGRPPRIALQAPPKQRPKKSPDRARKRPSPQSSKPRPKRPGTQNLRRHSKRR
ncbi:MAG: DNA-3-methyladenine glycosylase family protein [Steroidobacterales bacterium]